MRFITQPWHHHLRRVARIEEVNRIIEVLNSIGVKTRWIDGSNDLVITPRLASARTDGQRSRQKTRTVIMFLGPLLHQYRSFRYPTPAAAASVRAPAEPHLDGLRHFGLNVLPRQIIIESDRQTISPATHYHIDRTRRYGHRERLMAAALYDGETVIRNASPNYMVQDVCYF